ncbi:DUF2637 domain-containing protein [Streptomyces iakyrus]|uniref:DUF2637 domain-containing protein n=1 Tax=Streptomyces iakyrus TaxID=68219 RepID=UPI0036EB3AEB
MIIAGIGFAGSYTAVRELALDKGFGTFSHLFPIGIDAGICVTLALDLLLTWIRIPFPLLRHTAWLLTSATIAFNGAAAWPDPLGVAMHAVIPLLFVVTVEAARHAIGRIADITADTHMEPVRLTRWLLSPIPTFLLWRRMKLWELRSYNHVIKLEQERLTYQARLRTHYGRRWRRKAPIEALLPLQLARHGIPLTDSAPASPAQDTGKPATLLQPPTPLSTPRNSAATQPLTDRIHEPQPDSKHAQPAPGAKPHTSGANESDSEGAKQSTHNSSRHVDADPHVRPAPTQTGPITRHTQHSQDHAPNRAVQTPEHNCKPHATRSDQAEAQAAGQPVPHTDAVPAPATTLKQTAANPPQEAVLHTPVDDPHKQPDPASQFANLSAVDRYYLAWTDYQSRHDAEPTDKELSAYLASQGIYSRNRQPVSPATLRRYLLSYRIYDIWTRHRAHNPSPSLEAIAQDCTDHRITGQYNKPITTHYLARHTNDYERRWQTLHHPNTSARASASARRSALIAVVDVAGGAGEGERPACQAQTSSRPTTGPP